MLGLRFNSQSFSIETRYGIREIINCLGPDISQLYCIAYGDFLMWKGEDADKLENELASFVLEELDHVGNEIRGLKLFRPGFLPRFRDYLYGDWNHFYLLETKIPCTRCDLGAMRSQLSARFSFAALTPPIGRSSQTTAAYSLASRRNSAERSPAVLKTRPTKPPHLAQDCGSAR
jgi:hypothetical protein